jgi:SAM-dependent methyltransferase
MHLDVIDLRDFYSSLLGRIVTRHVGDALDAVMPPGPCGRLVGIGFATPYLGGYDERAERLAAFMPAPQGVIDWPSDKPSKTALVEEARLPLSNASADLVILVHALEMSSRPSDLMDEVRRILSPRGRLVVVVPNRQGPWARSDISPFGFGRPYSRGQLRAVLADAEFETEAWATALHMPPVARRPVLRLAGGMEKIGRVCWPAFSGVTCVRASKSTVQGARVRARSALAPALRPALQPNTGRIRSGTSV